MIVSNRHVVSVPNTMTTNENSDDSSASENTEVNNEHQIVDISDKSMVDIAKMVASMISSEHLESDTDNDYIHEKLHELCTRVAVCEALIEHMNH